MGTATSLQTSSIILPIVAPLGTETETVNDALEHTSLDIDSSPQLQEKVVQIWATEVWSISTSGPLWVWVELSPYPSSVSTSYFSAIGGGGGAVAPMTPKIIVARGTSGTVQTHFLAWTVHSACARVVVQAPADVDANDYWTVQIIVEGKTY